MSPSGRAAAPWGPYLPRSQGTRPSQAPPDLEESRYVSATWGTGDASDFVQRLLSDWAQPMVS